MCVFCGIIEGQLPSKKVYEDDDVLAFHDINPQAPVHIIIIPKKHFAGLDAMNAEDSHLAAKCLMIAAQTARDLGIDKTGYRVITNWGEHGLQSVHHMHFHLVGGKQLSGEMG